MLNAMAPILRTPTARSRARPVLAGVALTVAFSLTLGGRAVAVQAAVDPNVAPRAAALERQGERQLATDLLGRYLAVAPDDGRAWFQLGRFYRLDARDWHRVGHAGDPDGHLYLELAGVAADQALRLAVDSALLLRGMIDMDRSLLFIEDSGWVAARDRRSRSGTHLPRVVIELGYNLLGSCPVNGVLVTGTELESVAVWYGVLEAGFRTDVVLLRTDLYATDSLYRRRMAIAIQVDAGLPVRTALAAVAAKRALCLSPGADTAAVEVRGAAPVRLVRVLGPALEITEDNLSLTELLLDTRQGGSIWSRDVLGVYAGAASHNSILCNSLVVLAGDLPSGTCRR
jgi:hypothetical protein